jgi:hypothetical protein
MDPLCRAAPGSVELTCAAPLPPRRARLHRAAYGCASPRRPCWHRAALSRALTAQSCGRDPPACLCGPQRPRPAAAERSARWRGALIARGRHGGGAPLDCSTDGAVEGSRAVEQWREGAVEPGSVLACSSEIRPRRARPRRATGRAHSASSSLAAGRSRSCPPPRRARPRRSRPPERTAAAEIRLPVRPAAFETRGGREERSPLEGGAVEVRWTTAA